MLENALTLYERDGGLLWKHFDYETGKSDTRRARELVIGYTVVVGNYDYGVSWIFRQGWFARNGGGPRSALG